MKKDTELINLANNIKKYRVQSGYTQDRLAKEIGKTSNFLSQLENAHKGLYLRTLFEIARVLDVQVYQFFEPYEENKKKVEKYKKETENELTYIANNIKKYRVQKCYTQNELAKKIDKTPNAIAQMENARKGLHLSTLFNIARVLDTPVSQFFKPCEKTTQRAIKYKKR